MICYRWTQHIPTVLASVLEHSSRKAKLIPYPRDNPAERRNFSHWNIVNLVLGLKASGRVDVQMIQNLAFEKTTSGKLACTKCINHPWSLEYWLVTLYLRAFARLWIDVITSIILFRQYATEAVTWMLAFWAPWGIPYTAHRRWIGGTKP